MLQSVFCAHEIYSSDKKNHSISKEKFFKIGDIWIAIMEGEPIEKTYNHIAFHVEQYHLPVLRINHTKRPGTARRRRPIIVFLRL